MQKPLFIIKLGGSVITYKDSSIPKIRTSVINRLAKEIKHIKDEINCRVIIVHGVGSFGHPAAKKYNLSKGMTTKEEKYGYCLMEAQDLELNSKILSAFIKFKIPAIGFSPHSFITTSNKNFSGFDTSIIEGYLHQDIVPVLHGDAVLDKKLGCSILSGDISVSFLAKKLKADKIIFVSDVDGIFDIDPKKNPNAKLIPLINNKNLNEVLLGLTPNNKDDVTGEMKGKVLEIQKYLSNIPVLVVNGYKPKTLIKAVSGEAIGTQLLFR
ncbi:MAG: isopentenyl phosphate kinase [Microgenomates group bacterium]|jgi:isopentenyl phosphate kinase